MSPNPDTDALIAEIAHLKSLLSSTPTLRPFPALPSHPLLLLSDSALPLGSFAYSSGLESYLSHHPHHPSTTFPTFLHLSLLSITTTTLPFLLAAFRWPQRLVEVDDTLDACTLCPVARKASVAQGRALLAVWERSFRSGVPTSEASATLAGFSAALKSPLRYSVDGERRGTEMPHAHLPALFAVVASALGLTLDQCAYIYLFNHAKSVVSAAVRKGVMGPYQAQGWLAGGWLRAEIEEGLKYVESGLAGKIEDGWERASEEAGQSVPVMEVWGGRHEMVYSRMFVS